MQVLAETDCGRVAGRQQNGVQIFRGIPYARPPLGPLRFAAPVPAKPWSGVREAFEFGPSAPQNPVMLPLPGLEVGPTHEDCLSLNVYTPAADGASRPVLVWIHGGGFVIGSGSQSIYDGVPLARRGDVVVVTINYRLGALGFLYLNELCPERPELAANPGLRDQVAALEWVQRNIGAFGGDPSNVTLFGESAGGMSVATLLGTPAARGLFARAIAQSGAAHNVHDPGSASRVAEHFLSQLATSPSDAFTALRNASPARLCAAQQKTMQQLGTTLGLLPFQPVVDGELLPQAPLAAIQAGAATDVSLLTGTTRDEWKLFRLLDTSLRDLDEARLRERVARLVPSERVEPLLAAYGDLEARPPDSRHAEALFAFETDRIFRIPALRMAEAQAKHAARTFVYQFNWASPALGGLLGACHAVDLPFVFGVLDVEGAKLFAGADAESQRLSGRVMDAWLAFARDGDPSHADLCGGPWEAFDATRRAILLFDRNCELAFAPGEARRVAWEGLL